MAPRTSAITAGHTPGVSLLATLIIGLREGLEAALIVGIIAAFLSRQGRKDALVWMWIGVAVAVTICVAVAVGLEILSKDLPQKQQEGLETVIGVVAVAMVTYMIIWMKRHSRDLKGDLESAASGAVRSGSVIALVSMAFLAVLREGLETSVFLLAAFNASANALSATAGAVIGIALSVLLGYGIYRGGIHLNLSKFFTITGLLLVLVAAGLVMSALRTAHEAGWLNIGQQTVLDLSWLVSPGSIQSSLLTGVFGVAPKVTLIEAIGWLIYVIVVGTIVVWPAGRAFPRRQVGLGLGAAAAASLIAAVAVFATAPAQPTAPSDTLTVSTDGAPVVSGILAGRPAAIPAPLEVTVSDVAPEKATGRLRTGSVVTDLPNLRGGDTSQANGVQTRAFQQIVSPTIPISAFVADAPTTVTVEQIVAANGGRLPVGLDPRTFGASAPVVYAVVASVQVSTDTTFNRPTDAAVKYTVTATVTPERGAATVLGKVVELRAAHALSPSEASTFAAAADEQHQHHTRGVTVPLTLAIVGLVLAAISLAMLRGRFSRGGDRAGTTPTGLEPPPDEQLQPAVTSSKNTARGATTEGE